MKGGEPFRYYESRDEIAAECLQAIASGGDKVKARAGWLLVARALRRIVNGGK